MLCLINIYIFAIPLLIIAMYLSNVTPDFFEAAGLAAFNKLPARVIGIHQQLFLRLST
jgi:hypothetical protein